ncbi:hypothetical protein ScPMuIL_016934 [Solemya velum]
MTSMLYLVFIAVLFICANWTTDVLWVSLSSTTVECSIHCANDQNCNTSKYSSSAKTCSAFDAVHHDGNTLEALSGVGESGLADVVYMRRDRTIMYIGCYIDRWDRDIVGYLIVTDLNTPQYCMETCSEKGFKYAAVQYGRECFCGDTFGKYGAAPEAHCNNPCPNNPQLMCGGFWRQNVYSYTKD